MYQKKRIIPRVSSQKNFFLGKRYNNCIFRAIYHWGEKGAFFFVFLFMGGPIFLIPNLPLRRWTITCVGGFDVSFFGKTTNVVSLSLLFSRLRVPLSERQGVPNIFIEEAHYSWDFYLHTVEWAFGSLWLEKEMVAVCVPPFFHGSVIDFSKLMLFWDDPVYLRR